MTLSGRDRISTASVSQAAAAELTEGARLEHVSRGITRLAVGAVREGGRGDAQVGPEVRRTKVVRVGRSPQSSPRSDLSVLSLIRVGRLRPISQGKLRGAS